MIASLAGAVLFCALNRSVEYSGIFSRSLEKFPEHPKGVLVFVTDYGPFTDAGIAGGGDEFRHINQAKRMKRRLHPLSDGFSSRRNSNTAPEGISRYRSTTGSVALKIVPATFRDALWLQLAQALSDGARDEKMPSLRRMVSGGGGNRSRADAEFCSDEHRKRSNSLKRSRI